MSGENQEQNNTSSEDIAQIFRKSNSFSVILEFYEITLKVNVSLN